jgi:ribosomal protein S18 acetylase RimI-like enzyme
MPVIRPYRPADREGLANVCIRTGAGGEDATHDYADPTILPQIFAAPYAHLEPTFAFVVEDTAGPDTGPDTAGPDTAGPDTAAGPDVAPGPDTAAGPDAAAGRGGVVDGIVGYILGTPDTAVFARRFRDEWVPLVGDAYPPANARASDKRMADLLHNPGRMVVPELVDWPAHLHIDILPAYQRQGLGRQLMDTFTGALRKAGVTAVHLGMSSSNARARAFYDRMGFHVLDVPGPDDVTHMGLRLA